MRTNFLKIAALLSLGAISFFTSCNKEELEENNGNPNVTVNDSKTDDEFDKFIEELSKDTNAVVASISAKKLNAETLRSQRSLEHRDSYYDRILDVVVAGNRGEKFTANGFLYQKLDVDLNMGAGGAYQYLYVAYGQVLDNNKTWIDKGITSIDAFYNTNCQGRQNMVQDLTYGGIANVNKGTKGGCINLQKNIGIGALTDIAVVAYKHSANSTITAFSQFEGPITLKKGASKMDLNKGAGGRYIYIFYR